MYHSSNYENTKIVKCHNFFTVLRINKHYRICMYNPNKTNCLDNFYLNSNNILKLKINY